MLKFVFLWQIIHDDERDLSLSEEEDDGDDDEEEGQKKNKNKEGKHSFIIVTLRIM